MVLYSLLAYTQGEHGLEVFEAYPLAEAREITELEILEAHNHAVHRYVAEQED